MSDNADNEHDQPTPDETDRTPQPDAASPTDASSPDEAMADAGEAAEQALSAAQQAVDDLSGSDDGGSLQLPEFGNAGEASLPLGIELLSQVNLNVRIELGRSRMLVEDVLRLNEGSVVELDKLAGDPVDVYVNDRHVARGEVLVLNDSFCVRINEIVTQPRGITRQVVEPEEMAG